jgi:hypothetical protein
MIEVFTSFGVTGRDSKNVVAVSQNCSRFFSYLGFYAVLQLMLLENDVKTWGVGNTDLPNTGPVKQLSSYLVR